MVVGTRIRFGLVRTRVRFGLVRTPFRFGLVRTLFRFGWLGPGLGLVRFENIQLLTWFRFARGLGWVTPRSRLILVENDM